MLIVNDPSPLLKSFMASDDRRDPPVQVRVDPVPPAHLLANQDSVVAAIKAAAVERVAAYRQSKDTGRLNGREAVRDLVGKYGPEEVQCWIDEMRAEARR